MTASTTNNKFWFTLVEFYWNLEETPNPLQGTRFSNFRDVDDYETPGFYVYKSTLAVTIAKNSGSLEEQVTTVEMAYDPSIPLHAMAVSGEPCPPITCLVRQRTVDPVTGESSPFTFFTGKVRTVILGPNNQIGVIRFEAVTFKAELDVPLGIPANNQCAWTFGGIGCNGPSGISIEDLRKPGLLTAFDPDDPTKVTITGLPTHIDTYWRGGYISYDSIRIPIRYWIAAEATTFHLAQKPPAAWFDAPIYVTVTPGCSKQLGECRDKWNNEINFGGFGAGIPSWHPVYEDTGEGTEPEEIPDYGIT